MRNSGMGTNSFFGAISLFVFIFPFVHTVERARSLYVFTLCFLVSKPPDMSKVENSCPKAEKVKKNDKSRPGYSRLFRTALSSSGQLSEVSKLPRVAQSSKKEEGEKRNNLEYKTSQIVLRCSRIFFSKPNSINVGKRIDLFRFLVFLYPLVSRGAHFPLGTDGHKWI